MGLFINKKQHPNVYKTEGVLIEPNQVEYCITAFTDFVKEQRASNKSLNKAIDGISNSQDKFQLQQNRQWREMEQRIVELKTLHKEHEKVEKQVVSWLQKLESKQTSLQTMIRNDQQDKKEFMLHIQNLSNSQQEISSQLDDLGEAKESITKQIKQLATFRDEVLGQFELVNAANEEILCKMDEQSVQQHQIEDKLTNIEESQQEVITRVDGQEGIIDKMIHQIDQVRFILFERTNYLEEKMENIYQQAVAYIQKIKSSVIQTSTINNSKNKQKENKEV